MNQIMTINPYKKGAVWVFDDENFGLVAEPFVCGMNEIIDLWVAKIPDAKKGFTALFSPVKFPSCQHELITLWEENGGCWVKDKKTGMKGWLCSKVFCYLPQIPKSIYIQVC